jgi:predicted Zn-dependent peptidase
VTGREDVVRRLDADALRRFRARCWGPRRGIAVLAGDARALPSPELVEPLLERITGAGERRPTDAPQLHARRVLEHAGGRRALIRLAYPLALDVRDGRLRAALKVLTSIVGSPIGSRLQEELRETRGLCYSVFATDRTAADAAVLKLGAEVAPERAQEALEVMRELVAGLRVTADELDRARSHVAGTRVLALEQSRAVAQYAARQWVVYGAPVDPQDAVRSIEAVTAEDVAEVCEAIAADCAVACVVPDGTDVSL